MPIESPPACRVRDRTEGRAATGGCGRSAPRRRAGGSGMPIATSSGSELQPSRVLAPPRLRTTGPPRRRAMSKLPGLRLAFLAASLVPFAACGSGGGGANSGPMDLVVVSNGVPGQLLPYQIHTLTAPGGGLPTPTVIEIRRIVDLVANVNRSNPNLNPVLPVPNWPTGATLPNGDPGNHFVLVQFTRPIKVDSV